MTARDLADTPTGFKAKPRWQRWLWRKWRLLILCRLPGKEGMWYIVPPREWEQGAADEAILRGRELAEKYGW